MARPTMPRSVSGTIGSTSTKTGSWTSPSARDLELESTFHDPNVLQRTYEVRNDLTFNRRVLAWNVVSSMHYEGGLESLLNIAAVKIGASS